MSYPLVQQNLLPQPTTPPAPTAAGSSTAANAKDPLRDTLLRYLGYTNEFGECGKDLFEDLSNKRRAHQIVSATYKVVGGYVGVDALHKTFKGYKKAEEDGYEMGGKLFTAAEKGVDAALFQAAASLYGPAFAVATFRDVSKNALLKAVGDKDGSDELEKEIRGLVKDKKALSITAAPERLKNVLFKPLQHVKPIQALKDLSPKTKGILTKYVPMTASLALIPFLVHPIDSGVEKVLDATYRPLMSKIKHGLFGSPGKPAKQADSVQLSAAPTFGRHMPPQNSFSSNSSFANWGYLA